MDNTFGGDQFYNHDESTAGAKDQKAGGIAPLVIAQLLNCDGESFKMFGMSFGTVTIVAIVREIEPSSTKLTYLLEDHTGQITANFWIEEGETPNTPDVMINSYARVYGTFRKYAGKKTLIVFKMFPMNNLNVLNTHLLEVICHRYEVEKYMKEGLPINESIRHDDHQGISDNNLGLTGKTLAIYQTIRELSKIGDVSTQDLQKKFKHISMQEIRSILDSLASEGHIYATLDSDHYLSTDA